MNKLISCVCCTYGRVERLREAIACFLNQTYQEKQLVILNSCPEQTLVADYLGVKVVNLTERPESLGATRNLAVEHADGEIIVVFDDDDLADKGLLSQYAEAFTPGVDWVRLFPTFYSEGWQIRKLFPSWINAISFTKEAFQKVGGYPKALSVGEDQDFFRRLSEQCKGNPVELPAEKIQWIYCWGNQTEHISGLGLDREGLVPAWERARLKLAERIRLGKEPTGRIVLDPKLAHDPRTMIEAYIGKKPVRRVESKKLSVCFVQLGRYGDIINMLPLVYHVAQNYDVPSVMVSKEFADIFDGISYAEPYVVPFQNDQLIDAMDLAHRKFNQVINTQIWGRKWEQQRRTPAFNYDSFVNAGFGYLFYDFSLYPVFDKRDRVKEQAYASKLFQTDKNKILVNVHSTSSPFKRGAELLSKIQEAHGEAFEVVDVTALRVDHLYDLLGAIEQAACVVSMDTSLVHLTAGTSTPLVCIVPPAWTGSIPRCPESRVFTYTEIEAMLDSQMDNAFNEAIRSYAERFASVCLPTKEHLPPPPPPNRTIYHVVERHEEKNVPEAKRKRHAQSSWDALYRNSNVIPVHFWEPYPRNAKQELGDPRPLPYLKDVFAAGMEQASLDDIILWNNDDNWLHPLLPDIVRYHCSLWEVVTSQRCEFMDGPILSASQSPDKFATAGRLHMGRDIFAATKRWLVKHWDEIPDFVIGCSDFDLCLAAMVRNRWGFPSTSANLEVTMWPAELKRGYVSHQYHPPKWREKGYENVAPGQLHNRRLFKEWAQKNLPSLKFTRENTI